MQRGLKIAICGKGGVGKTTLSAVWAQLFAQDGLEVLAIDADSKPNLSLAFGVPLEKCPTPLIDMKDLIAERTDSQKGAYGQYFKLNPQVADLPDEYSLKVDGVKLLVLGGIDQAGAGCACPEGAFLKALLTYSMLQRQEMILVDLEAGLEFLGRACVQGVDALVTVIEPGSRSLETARSIARMAGEMGIKKVAAFANKITDEAQVEVIKSQLGEIPLLGSYRHDPSLQTADLKGEAILTACPELVEELKKAKLAMEKYLDSEAND